MARIIKFIWLISLLSGLATLLYTYASMGEIVSINSDTLVTESGSVTREVYFYTALAILIIFNFSFYAISRNMHMNDDHMKTLLINWQLSFAAILNLFYIVGVLFIMLVNSGDNFDYGNFGYLIYIALAFIILWVIALPLLIMRERSINRTL